MFFLFCLHNIYNINNLFLFSGGLITKQKYKINTKTELIINTKLKSSEDSGIYICIVQFPTSPTSYLLLEFISLVIETTKPLIIDHGSTIQLSCNGGYIIRTLIKNQNLYQVWIKNEKIIRNDSLRNNIIDERIIDTLYISNSYLNDTGTYKCFISDPAINRRWYTAFYILKVKNTHSISNIAMSFQIIMLCLIVATYATFKTYKSIYY